MRPLQVSASILSADFARMGEEVQAVDAAGADVIHLDVMDGAFVPNLTFGAVLVKALRPVTDKPFDVHAMVADPGRFVEPFAQAGAQLLTVHVEACIHLQRVLAQIREAGMRAGVAVNPATPVDFLEYVLDDLDHVLLMTVNPGFSGQRFLPAVMAKVRRVRELVAGRPIDIGVDGGVAPQTAPACREAGANVLIAATAIFGQSDYARAIADLRG
ncbi:MAG: ribulose-phosphate 3-epimerase [Candidatus Xenobia bacterium]